MRETPMPHALLRDRDDSVGGDGISFARLDLLDHPKAVGGFDRGRCVRAAMPKQLALDEFAFG